MHSFLLQPKKKRGVSSILASYPDEGTRGPRHSWQKDRPSKMEIVQGDRDTVEENCATSAVFDNIEGTQNKTNSNQHNTEKAVDGSQTESSVTVVANLTKNNAMETCCIEETGKHPDTSSESSVVNKEKTTCVIYGSIANDFQEDCQIGSSYRTLTAIETSINDSSSQIEAVQKISDNITLASDTETGADDLDALIKAVTKDRNKTSKKSTLEVGMLTDPCHG